MKGIFAAMLLFVSFSLTAQDSLVIPAGVAYKKKTAEVNNRARTLLLMELNENTVTYSLFDASVFMGPLLWKRYKAYEAIGKIKEGNVQFHVPITDPVTKKISQEVLNGKLIQQKDDFKKVWKQIIADMGNSVPVIRKIREKELRYYWAIINFDIEEPVFVVETGSFNLLVQFIESKTDSKMTVLFLEEMPKAE
ncbi:MAG: hypothetical protein IPP96_11125 [Chitinophagaceae bacterium]|nr:hypothetical protein [Chitinophagaceae bacterium]